MLTYVAEVTEPRYRGMLAATGPTTVIIGILFEFVMGAFMHWRQVAIYSCVLPFFTILALCFVPESPYWLINKNRIADAQESLAWLRGWTTIAEVQSEFDEIHDGLMKQKKKDEQTIKKSIMHRIVPYTKRSFVAPFALISFGVLIGHFSGITTLQTFAVQIFKTLKVPIDEYYATIFFGVAELFGALICVVAVRYTGKRPLELVSLIGCGICFMITAIYAERYIQTSTHSLRSFDAAATNSTQNCTVSSACALDSDELHWLPLTAFLFSALFAHAGFRLIPWMMIGEVFPTSVRSGAAGMAAGTGYFFGFLTNKIFLGMIAAMTLTGTFWFSSMVSFVGCVVLYFIMPETEGKSLLDIEPHFTGKSPPKIAKGPNGGLYQMTSV